MRGVKPKDPVMAAAVKQAMVPARPSLARASVPKKGPPKKKGKGC